MHNVKKFEKRVHADLNGVVVFPYLLTDFVIEEAAKVTDREASNFNWVNSNDFTLQKMIDKG